MPINAKNGLIYESYAMHHPDGTLMCRCNFKKASWYIERGLAEWIDDSSFKLNFVPQGHGKHGNEYYTQTLENKCVVCGTAKRLNKHHVVPYVFRSRFPLEYKSSNHHDVLPTCVKCHENYEGYANTYKAELAKKYDGVFSVKQTPEEKRNRKVISARRILARIEEGLLEGSGLSDIPEDRLNYLRSKAQEELLAIENKQEADWADTIVEKIILEGKIEEFVREWRTHFIVHAKPKYLPKHWSVDSPIEISGKS